MSADVTRTLKARGIVDGREIRDRSQRADAGNGHQSPTGWLDSHDLKQHFVEDGVLLVQIFASKWFGRTNFIGRSWLSNRRTTCGQSNGGSKIGRAWQKASGGPKETVLTSMDPDVIRRIKAAAALRDKTASYVLEEAARQRLDRHPDGKKVELLVAASSA